jgi:hypothetical protein
MGYTGRARVNARFPRAHAICDRCGFRYNHQDLSWQFDWQGPRVINKRILVCEDCLDRMQEQKRVIVIPADPLPIMNPRPEDYVSSQNPIRVSQSANARGPSGFLDDDHLTDAVGGRYGGNNTFKNARLAFNGNPCQDARMSAFMPVSISGYNNFIGYLFPVDPSGVQYFPATAPLPLNPSGMTPTTQDVLVFGVNRVVVYAPSDSSFNGTSTPMGYQIISSVPDDGVTNTVVATGTTAGTVAEVLDISIPTKNYSTIKIIFNGNGVYPLYVAQMELYSASIGKLIPANLSIF